MIEDSVKMVVNIKCPVTPCQWQSGEHSEGLAERLYNDHMRHVHDIGKDERAQVMDESENFQVTRFVSNTFDI